MANVSKYYEDGAIFDALRNTSSGQYELVIEAIEVFDHPPAANATPRTTIRVTLDYEMDPSTAKAILEEAEAAHLKRTQ